MNVPRLITQRATQRRGGHSVHLFEQKDLIMLRDGA
jgi:hypothetical protein